MAGPARPAWQRELSYRMRKLLLLKLIGISAFVWLFFVGYFYLLGHPSGPVTEMPLTALDRLIGFQPLAFGVYVSLWLYVGVAPGLMRDLRELLVYGLWMSALCATGLGIFYLWPTSVPPDAANASIALLQGLDAAGNACPSMHVATAVFSMVWVDHVLRKIGAPAPLRALNAGWFVAIAYSTLAIKQHVVLDVLAGALLGGAFALVSLWPARAARRAA
jgi:membrane-associated phospholipid phosphatase